MLANSSAVSSAMVPLDSDVPGLPQNDGASNENPSPDDDDSTDHGRLSTHSGCGRKCVIWEKAVIGAGKSADGDRGDASVILQDYVTVGSGASVEASVVGEGSEIGVKAAVGRGVTLGKWCKICPLEVVVGEVEPEVEAFTVVFGDGRRRVDGSAKAFEEVRRAKREGTAKQVEGLRRLIPDASAKWTGVG